MIENKYIGIYKIHPTENTLEYILATRTVFDQKSKQIIKKPTPPTQETSNRNEKRVD